MAIRLIKDKTHLHPDLQIGAIGKVTGTYGIDSNCIVYFPSIGQSFHIMDNQFEDYLTPQEQLEKDKELMSAINVNYNTGPRGGFREITYTHVYPKFGIRSIRDRHEGLKIKDFFEKHNINVTTIIEK